MGFGVRVFFVDEDDTFRRIPAARFSRIMERDPKEAIPTLKNQRIRYAEMVVELENREPVAIARIDYSFLQFDDEGLVDPSYMNDELQVVAEMMAMPQRCNYSANVIPAAYRFAGKRYKDRFTWTPSNDLEIAMVHEVFGICPI
jgi:hypothetical protein